MEKDIYTRFNSCSSKEPILILDNSLPLKNVEQCKSWNGIESYIEYESDYKKGVNDKNDDDSSNIIVNSSMGYNEALLQSEALFQQKNKLK